MHSILFFLLAALFSQPFDYTDLVVSPDHGVRYVSGVLGYTRSCGYAIYPDRLAAVTRDQATAFILEPKSFSEALTSKIPIDALTHQYIFLTGRIERAPAGFGGMLRVASARVPQQDSDFAQTSEARCLLLAGNPISVLDAITRASMKGWHEKQTFVYGYIHEDREYGNSYDPNKPDHAQSERGYAVRYTLYASREAYDDRVHTERINASVAGDLPLGCEGRLVLMDGKLVRRGINDGYSVTLTNARVIEDACAGRDSK